MEKPVLSTPLPEKCPDIGIDFGVALQAVKMAKAIYRAGWNDNSIRVKLIAVPFQDEKNSLVLPAMFDTEGKVIDYWHPSPTDMMAEDWKYE